MACAQKWAKFGLKGNLVTYTVPTTGLYRIVTFGAQGGNATGPGGLGAEIGGDFTLVQDETLKIAVGGAGMAGGGGGGGTFVVDPDNTPLVIAGAGGGGGGNAGSAGGTGQSGGGAGGGRAVTAEVVVYARSSRRGQWLRQRRW